MFTNLFQSIYLNVNIDYKTFFMTKIPKVIVSCRIPPFLKEEMEDEAMAADLTVSNYVKRILENRHHNDSEDLETLIEKIQSLESELETLYEGNDEYESQVEELKEQVQELQFDKNDLEQKIKDKELTISEFSEREADFLEDTMNLKIVSKKLKELESQFPFQFESFEKEQFTSYLEQLMDYHPDESMSQLLLGALDTAIRTETSFWTVPTMKSYFKNAKTIEL